MATPHFRIASLVPAGTDLIAALGLGHYLIGVSHACDHPIAHGKPILTRSLVSSVTEPAAIDRAVREAAHAGESLFLADRARLRELDPDVIVTQDVCDVCALPSRELGPGLPPRAEIVTLQARTITGLFSDLVRLGEATSVAARAEHVVASVRARLESVRTRERHGKRTRVLALEWSDPPFAAGHFTPELVELAGGECLLAETGEASQRLTWDTIRAADPDVIVFMPCGYGLEAAKVEAVSLAQQPPVRDLRAVREGRFYATDAAALFSRCTPESLAQGAEALYAILSESALPDSVTRVAVP